MRRALHAVLESSLCLLPRFPWHPFPYQIHFSMFSLNDVDVRPESGDPSVNSTVKKNLQDFVALYISTGACTVATSPIPLLVVSDQIW